jgi:hypothetical protein
MVKDSVENENYKCKKTSEIMKVRYLQHGKGMYLLHLRAHFEAKLRADNVHASLLRQLIM